MLNGLFKRVRWDAEKIIGMERISRNKPRRFEFRGIRLHGGIYIGIFTVKYIDQEAE